MEMPNKPPIHLWIYNHPFNGISDQVEFFISAFRQHGYAVSVGRQPSNSALNVVIENFSDQTIEILAAFCQSTRKKVSVIMTEHLDFESGEIFFHGNPILRDNDYMHPETQLNRIRYLLDCIPYIRCFLVLGDLPELRNMSAMLPGIDVRSIPFPMLDLISNNDTETSELINNGLLFTGYMTEYRSNIFDLLQEYGFSVAYPNKFVPRKKRNAINRSSKLILNIPQRTDWRWLSLMRIINALRCGRATVSVGTHDDSKIAACTYQLDMSDQGWPDILTDYVENWSSLYQTAHENYTSMASEYEQLKGFPHDILEYWAITDQINAR